MSRWNDRDWFRTEAPVVGTAEQVRGHWIMALNGTDMQRSTVKGSLLFLREFLHEYSGTPGYAIASALVKGYLAANPRVAAYLHITKQKDRIA